MLSFIDFIVGTVWRHVSSSHTCNFFPFLFRPTLMKSRAAAKSSAVQLACQISHRLTLIVTAHIILYFSLIPRAHSSISGAQSLTQLIKRFWLKTHFPSIRNFWKSKPRGGHFEQYSALHDRKCLIFEISLSHAYIPLHGIWIFMSQWTFWYLQCNL